jgi:hypothetical protein
LARDKKASNAFG